MHCFCWWSECTETLSSSSSRHVRIRFTSHTCENINNNNSSFFFSFLRFLFGCCGRNESLFPIVLSFGKIKIADWIASFYLSCLLSLNGDKRAACSPWNQFQIIGYGFLVIAFVYFISVSWNEGIAWWIMSFKKVSKNQVLKSGRSLSVIVVNDNEIRVIQCNTHTFCCNCKCMQNYISDPNNQTEKPQYERCNQNKCFRYYCLAKESTKKENKLQTNRFPLFSIWVFWRFHFHGIKTASIYIH